MSGFFGGSGKGKSTAIPKTAISNVDKWSEPDITIEGFDTAAYLKANPDVVADAYWGARPALHYETHGKAEGREFFKLKTDADKEADISKELDDQIAKVPKGKMPSPGDDSVFLAKKRAIAKAMSAKGRASTILSNKPLQIRGAI